MNRITSWAFALCAALLCSTANATTIGDGAMAFGNAGGGGGGGGITGSGTTDRLTVWTSSSAVGALGAGTTATVLHGNAGGLPSFGAVALATDVSGTLPVANGGTGATTLLSPALLFGQGTGAVGASANAAWNNTNQTLYLGGTDPADAEYALQTTKAATSRWYNRAAGTTTVADITQINTTNSVNIQHLAYGSAAAGTTLGMSNANMAGILFRPAASTGSFISFGANDTRWLSVGYSDTEVARFSSTGLALETGATSSSEIYDAERNQSAATGMRLANTTSATTSQTYFQIQSSAHSTFLSSTSAAYTPTNTWDRASGSYLNAQGTGGLSLAATNAAGFMTFHAGGNTEWVRLTAAGNFGIGNAGANARLEVTGNTIPAVRVNGEGIGFADSYQYSATATAESSAALAHFRARGTIASPTVVSSGDRLGSWGGLGYDGSAYRSATEIASYVDGTPGSSDMPGRLVFKTSPDGAIVPLERLVIQADGSVRAGDSATTISGALNTAVIVGGGGTTHSGSMQQFVASATAGDAPFIAQRRARGTLTVPTIVSNGDRLGQFTAQGYDGSAYQAGPSILFEIDGAPGAGDMPSRMVFSTVSDGTTTQVEAMRINSSQQLLTTQVGVGTQAAPTSGIILDVWKDQNALTRTRIKNTTAGTGSAAELLVVSDASAGTLVAGVSSSSYTPTTAIGANDAYYLANGVNSLNIGTVSSAPVEMYVNGVLMMNWTTGGTVIGGGTAIAAESFGTCTLDGAATATCTGTVVSGANVCQVTDNSPSTLGVSAMGYSVSGTTVTVTSATTLDTSVVAFDCKKP